jgi:predicted GNAT family N-acyltransferase
MKILRPDEVTQFPEIRELTPEELKEVYALARAAFTAEDLQRYTELDEGVSADEVLAELEEAQRLGEKESA